MPALVQEGQQPLAGDVGCLGDFLERCRGGKVVAGGEKTYTGAEEQCETAGAGDALIAVDEGSSGPRGSGEERRRENRRTSAGETEGAAGRSCSGRDRHRRLWRGSRDQT